MSASFVLLLVPLLVLHFTPLFSSFAHDLANPATAASSTVRRVEVFLGVLVLVIAALMAVRFVTRRRARNTKTAAPDADSDASSPISRLLKRGRDAPAEGASAMQRLLGRANRAWESGALWVAFVIGFWAGPNPSLVMFSLATILASGAVIGAQIGAAVVFVVVSLAVVEVVLINNVLAPTFSRLVSLEHPEVIEEGMVFALETYWPSSDGWGAARIEEEMVVTANGCEVITKFPAEELLVAGQRYYTVSGPLNTERDSQSHLNTLLPST
ncbi:MAG: aminopeptidase family protein [Mycobacterium sp.]|nr:aminopeptidase family protein [Mycobacterium sp.]